MWGLWWMRGGYGLICRGLRGLVSRRLALVETFGREGGICGLWLFGGWVRSVASRDFFALNGFSGRR